MFLLYYLLKDFHTSHPTIGIWKYDDQKKRIRLHETFESQIFLTEKILIIVKHFKCYRYDNSKLMMPKKRNFAFPSTPSSKWTIYEWLYLTLGDLLYIS